MGRGVVEDCEVWCEGDERGVARGMAEGVKPGREEKPSAGPVRRGVRLSRRGRGFSVGGGGSGRGGCRWCRWSVGRRLGACEEGEERGLEAGEETGEHGSAAGEEDGGGERAAKVGWKLCGIAEGENQRLPSFSNGMERRKEKQNAP